jgi:hypothetical protein
MSDLKDISMRINSSDANRYGTVLIIVMLLLFTYCLIGGYTSSCNCGVTYQGTINGSHNGTGYGNKTIDLSNPPYTLQNVPKSSVYQSGPYLNF